MAGVQTVTVISVGRTKVELMDTTVFQFAKVDAEEAPKVNTVAVVMVVVVTAVVDVTIPENMNKNQ